MAFVVLEFVVAMMAIVVLEPSAFHVVLECVQLS